MKPGGRCTVQKSRPSSNLGVIAPWGCAPPKNLVFGYDVGKIGAGCLITYYILPCGPAPCFTMPNRKSSAGQVYLVQKSFTWAAIHTKTLVCQVHDPSDCWVEQTVLEKNNRTRRRLFQVLLPMRYPLQAQYKAIGCRHGVILTRITFARNQLRLYIKHRRIISTR